VADLVFASIVVIGVFLQVYLIAAYFSGAGPLSGWVLGLQSLLSLFAMVWRR
jgi:hypothetical protein